MSDGKCEKCSRPFWKTTLREGLCIDCLAKEYVKVKQSLKETELDNLPVGRVHGMTDEVKQSMRHTMMKSLEKSAIGKIGGQ